MSYYPYFPTEDADDELMSYYKAAYPYQFLPQEESPLTIQEALMEANALREDDHEDWDIDLLKQLMFMNEGQVFEYLLGVLQNYYPDNIYYVEEQYIYCKGTLPVMLIAHGDTVWSEGKLAFYDPTYKVFFGEGGLGADDRAGIFIILKLLTHGYRPHVLFTMGEESGGEGAKTFLNIRPKAPEDLKFLIQLDRQGYMESVFYDCDNKEFEDFINSYGFETEIGTFTDVKFISRAWGVAGVNLSVGYHDEHSAAERLYYWQLQDTYVSVEMILDDLLATPDEIKKYEFIEKKIEVNKWNWKKNTNESSETLKQSYDTVKDTKQTSMQQTLWFNGESQKTDLLENLVD